MYTNHEMQQGTNTPQTAEQAACMDWHSNVTK